MRMVAAGESIEEAWGKLSSSMREKGGEEVGKEKKEGGRPCCGLICSKVPCCWGVCLPYFFEVQMRVRLWKSGTRS